MKEEVKLGIGLCVCFGIVLMMLAYYRTHRIGAEPTLTPAATNTPTATEKPTERATATPTETPTITATSTPSPTVAPTANPTPRPTASPDSPQKKKVDSGHTFKPYTRHTAYNLKSSQQYKLQRTAWTSTENGIRIVEDPNGEWRYCVALGTYWAGGHAEHIGRCIDVYMKNGAVLKCVLGDVKRQEHTINQQNKYGGSNDVLEFIVDEKKIPAAVRNSGNVSNAGEEFKGDVDYMIVYDLWIEGFGKE